MTSSRILASIVIVMSLVSLQPPTSAQSFSLEKTVQDRMWLIKYVIAEGSSFSIGDVLTLVEGRRNKYPGNCFAEIQTIKWENYAVPESKAYLVWKRSRLDFLKRAKVNIDVGVKKEEGKPDKIEGHGNLTLEPREGARRISAFVSFNGKREEVHPQILNDYARHSSWSEKCVSILGSKDSFVVVDVIQGLIRIRFTQHIDDKFEPIDSPTPSRWAPVIVGESVKVGEFEREATLIVAGHPKLKKKGAKVIGMKLESYLPPFEKR